MQFGVAKKIAMVILMESDLPAAVDFYQCLGLHLLFHIKNQWAELELQSVKIGLCPTPKAEEVRTGLVFEVEDLLAVYTELKDKICFLHEPKQAVHGIMVSVKDPGGNIVDLYQPTPQKIHEFAEQTMQQKGCSESPEKCCKKSTQDE